MGARAVSGDSSAIHCLTDACANGEAAPLSTLRTHHLVYRHVTASFGKIVCLHNDIRRL
ncbi:hypothetical protein Rmet_6575 [Cupriavidus metallidurans CH34]|uniref:Uncharacterized protein n=1 Tax=Cupriavidus metallidurans (strain ATCC 43123 / DSM 2839 / NBRC 102507 / CH34) TaxID=266264 RepID=D3DY07_CUPMC|nr:hypothetical protein Rmet_6575 [Cupriavidus metallidurans CH34]